MEDRKTDHIQLAKAAQLATEVQDRRFVYEPLFGHLDLAQVDLSVDFAGFQLAAPLWISSMTGGTEKAGELNRLLAEVCNEFQFGMGLGSCRTLLESDKHFSDFDLRPLLGDDRPFFMNFGIAQIEQLIEAGSLDKIAELNERLRTNGLFIHLNPLQEWYQPEGDLIKRPILETVQQAVEELNLPIAIKEVGQGMGPKSLDALMRLPLWCIEFGAFGGTNFSMLENKRSDQPLDPAFCYIGQSAEDMINDINLLCKKHSQDYKCLNFIVSGGIKSFLDGHYLLKQLECQGIIGHASAFLGPASNGIDSLRNFTSAQVEGLKMAKLFLELRSN